MTDKITLTAAQFSVLRGDVNRLMKVAHETRRAMDLTLTVITDTRNELSSLRADHDATQRALAATESDLAEIKKSLPKGPVQ